MPGNGSRRDPKGSPRKSVAGHADLLGHGSDEEVRDGARRRRPSPASGTTQPYERVVPGCQELRSCADAVFRPGSSPTPGTCKHGNSAGVHRQQVDRLTLQAVAGLGGKAIREVDGHLAAQGLLEFAP
jgi:hypothetical protein